MREPLPIFILLVGLAKTVRYAILAAITTVNVMDEQTETMTISNRNDFALCAIEWAKAIVAEQGGNLAIATRNKGKRRLRRRPTSRPGHR